MIIYITEVAMVIYNIFIFVYLPSFNFPPYFTSLVGMQNHYKLMGTIKLQSYDENKKKKKNLLVFIIYHGLSA